MTQSYRAGADIGGTFTDIIVVNSETGAFAIGKVLTSTDDPSRAVEEGLAEVERLVARGDLHPDLPSMRSVGYRQVWGWLRGEFGREEMVKRGKAATRQLAKRQITWLRSERDTHLLDESGDPLTEALGLLESRLPVPGRC